MTTTAEMMAARARLVEVPHVQTTTRVFVAYYGEGRAALPLGVLTYCETLEAVELVYVQEGCRRLGLATRLLEFARERTGAPLDQDGGDRSAEGHAWANAVGLRVQGGMRRRALPQVEADAIGSRLMAALYGVLPVEADNERQEIA